MVRKTPVAAKELGVPYYVLMGLIRYEKIPIPARDSSLDFIWNDADMARAREALSKRRRVAPCATAS
jgi:hypothetical protein